MAQSSVSSTSKPPKSEPFSERPSDRLRQLGVESLSDAELLVLVLDTGRRTEPSITLALRLLSEFGGVNGLLSAGRGELAKVIGSRRSALLVSVVELARRAASQRLDSRTAYTSSRDVVSAFGPLLSSQADERVFAIVLDARQRPVAQRQLAAGGPASCLIGIRQVFALAVREGGAGVVLVHNHPSGDPTPSPEDLALTHALASAGHVLELPLVDHVIVGREGSFSFLDAGLLQASTHNDARSERGES